MGLDKILVYSLVIILCSFTHKSIMFLLLCHIINLSFKYLEKLYFNVLNVHIFKT